MRRPICYALMLTVSALAGLARADQLTMKNGDHLSGTVTRKSGDVLTFETSYAGTLKIRWTDVAELVTDKPVTVLLEDRSRVQASRFAAAADGPGLASASVSDINPPPEVTGEGIAFSGRINLGLNSTSGNTSTRAYHLDAEATARSGDHRIKLATTYNQASDDGSESIDNASLTAKYDHFINQRWYAYGYGKLARDQFKDLKLRREIGAGVGHQFYDSESRKLSLEAGLSQVAEDHYQAADTSGPSLRWAADYEQRLYRELATLFHHHELTWPVNDTRDLVVNAKTGLRVPVADGLTTTLEVDVDYDNRPSAGNSSTDLLYLFTLGYGW